MVGYFKPGDRAFLSDGWGDLIIVLSEVDNPKSGVDHRKSRLSSIFEIQRVLYEDFQVERTELMLRPQCIRVAALDPKNFYVRVIARILNNRTLEADLSNFEKQINHKFSIDGITSSDYSLALIPGLSDYDWKFQPAQPCNEEMAENLYDSILKGFLEGKIVDRFRTIIGKINKPAV